MTLNPAQLDTYKRRLLEEQSKIQKELGQVGEIDPHTKGDWVPKTPEFEEEADPVDVADRIEEMGERVGIESALETRLEDINKALAAIAAGTYSVCHIGGTPHEIPVGRLNANPASTTCIEHAD